MHAASAQRPGVKSLLGNTQTTFSTLREECRKATAEIKMYKPSISVLDNILATAAKVDSSLSGKFKAVSSPNKQVFVRPGEDRPVGCNLDVAIYMDGIEAVSHLVFVVEAKLVALKDLKHAGGAQLRDYLSAALRQQRARKLRGMLLGTDGFIMCTACRRSGAEDVAVYWDDAVGFKTAAAHGIIVDKVIKACAERVALLASGPHSIEVPRAFLNMAYAAPLRAGKAAGSSDATSTFDMVMCLLASGTQSEVALLAVSAEDALEPPQSGCVPSGVCVFKSVPSTLARYIGREADALNAVNASINAHRVKMAESGRDYVTRASLVQTLGSLASAGVGLHGLNGAWMEDVSASTQFPLPRCVAFDMAPVNGDRPWLAMLPCGRPLQTGSIGGVQVAQLVSSLFVLHRFAGRTHGDVRAANVMVYQGPMSHLLASAKATVDDMRAVLTGNGADSLMGAGSAMLIDLGCSLEHGTPRRLPSCAARALTPTACARDQAPRSRFRAAGRRCRIASCGASRRC